MLERKEGEYPLVRKCIETENPCGTDTVPDDDQCPSKKFQGKCVYNLVESLESQIIGGFYEERRPRYFQGPITNELEYVTTADEVNGYVDRIEELLDEVARLRAHNTILGRDAERYTTARSLVVAQPSLLSLDRQDGISVWVPSFWAGTGPDLPQLFDEALDRIKLERQVKADEDDGIPF
jgi:hypothetical protein